MKRIRMPQLRKGHVGRRIALALGGVLFLLAPIFVGSNVTTMGLLTQAVIYALVVVSLNLLVGFGRLVSLGQAGFLAIGAYAAGYSANHLHLPLPVELLLAGLLAGIVGFVLGLPAGRLSGNYLVIITLGFGLAVPQIALQATDLTNGFTGLTISNTQFGPIVMNSPKAMYYFALVVVAISVVLILLVLSSRTGRAIMAVRDSEAAAAAMGIPVARTKVVLFTLSAFFSGIAGDLFAHFEGLVTPADFTLALSLFFLAAVIVGGVGRVGGSIVGALFLVYVQTRSASVGVYSEFIIGAAVVVVLMVFPEGIASVPAIVAQRLHLTHVGGQTSGTTSPDAEEAAAVNVGLDASEGDRGGADA